MPSSCIQVNVENLVGDLLGVACGKSHNIVFKRGYHGTIGRTSQPLHFIVKIFHNINFVRLGILVLLKCWRMRQIWRLR